MGHGPEFAAFAGTRGSGLPSNAAIAGTGG
jgi:hypothetical protein